MSAKLNKKEIQRIKRNFNENVAWSTMWLKVITSMWQVSSNKHTAFSGIYNLTWIRWIAMQVSHCLPMLSMRLVAYCLGIVTHLFYSANQSFRIITSGKLRNTKHLPRKSHIYSMRFGSGDLAGLPMLWISSFSNSSSTATVWWHGALSSTKRNYKPIVLLRRHTCRQRISLQ